MKVGKFTAGDMDETIGTLWLFEIGIQLVPRHVLQKAGAGCPYLGKRAIGPDSRSICNIQYDKSCNIGKDKDRSNESYSLTNGIR